MKKLVFKKWLEVLLYLISFGALAFLCFEHESFKVMTIKNLICIIILLVNIILLNKYGRGEN